MGRLQVDLGSAGHDITGPSRLLLQRALLLKVLPKQHRLSASCVHSHNAVHMRIAADTVPHQAHPWQCRAIPYTATSPHAKETLQEQAHEMQRSRARTWTSRAEACHRTMQKHSKGSPLDHSDEGSNNRHEDTVLTRERHGSQPTRPFTADACKSTCASPASRDTSKEINS